MNWSLSILGPTLVLLVVLASSQNATAKQLTDPILDHLNQCVLSGEITEAGRLLAKCCYEKGCVICGTGTSRDCIF